MRIAVQCGRSRKSKSNADIFFRSLKARQIGRGRARTPWLSPLLPKNEAGLRQNIDPKHLVQPGAQSIITPYELRRGRRIPTAECPAAIKAERSSEMLNVVSTLGLLVWLWALTVLLVANKHG
jgi:hypothetical protein